MAFKILHFFLQSINYRENDLSSKASKLPHLANFVKKILRGNTRNREENFFFLPGFDCQMVHKPRSSKQFDCQMVRQPRSSKREGNVRWDEKKKRKKQRRLGEKNPRVGLQAVRRGKMRFKR
jgi:hypothetical protein